MPRGKTPVGVRLSRKTEPGPNGCIEWTGAKRKSGYGKIWDGEKISPTHVVAYIEAYGPVPEGLQVNHHCDNKVCVNAEHLYAGTQKQNVEDRNTRDRTARGAVMPTSKLDEAQVVAIYESDKTQKELIALYGMSKTQINSIKNGRRWAWLTADLVRGGPPRRASH